MGERLTDRLVKTLPVPASGSKITYDTEVKGFAARVTAAGARAFIVRYRIGGQARLFTIGSFPDWSTSAARDEARALKRRVDQDEDPMGERHQKRAEPAIDDLCDRYLSEHVIPHNKPSIAREVRRLVDAQIRHALGKLKISEISRAERPRLRPAANRDPHGRGGRFRLAQCHRCVSSAYRTLLAGTARG